MPEQMEQQEALHFKTNIRVNDDAETVENTGTGRFEVAILKDKSVLDHARRHLAPQLHHVVGWQSANQATSMQFMTWEALHMSNAVATILTMSCARRSLYSLHNRSAHCLTDRREL